MAGKLGTALLLVSLAALLSSCGEAPSSEASVDEAPAPAEESNPTTLPLKEIMAGLEEDLAEAAHGLWTEDPGVVATGATGIAEHPRVPPEQMTRIQAALGEEFSAFVAMDRRVHDDAVALVDAAESGRPVSDLFRAFVTIQEGCLSCHATFRTRVSRALAEQPSARDSARDSAR